MTTGASTARVVLVTLVLLSAPAWPAKDEWGLTDLMRNLKAVESSRARFSERKELALLNEPLESSGTLIYRAPGRLEKRTLTPERESLVLDQDTLVFENAERGWKKSFGLREHPVIWAFVESIRSTLAGDLATLQRFYSVKLEGDHSHWQLALVPRESDMKAVVDEILISGGGTSISRIEIREAGGDRSVMKIEREGP